MSLQGWRILPCVPLTLLPYHHNMLLAPRLSLSHNKLCAFPVALSPSLLLHSSPILPPLSSLPPQTPAPLSCPPSTISYPICHQLHLSPDALHQVNFLAVPIYLQPLPAWRLMLVLLSPTPPQPPNYLPHQYKHTIIYTTCLSQLPPIPSCFSSQNSLNVCLAFAAPAPFFCLPLPSLSSAI